jgi:hypothetical protein
MKLGLVALSQMQTQINGEELVAVHVRQAGTSLEVAGYSNLY